MGRISEGSCIVEGLTSPYAPSGGGHPSFFGAALEKRSIKARGNC